MNKERVQSKFKYIADLYTGNSIKDEEKGNYEDSSNARPYISSKDINAENNKVNYGNGMYVKLDDTSFKKAPINSSLMCIEGGSAGKKKTFLNKEVSFVNKLCCFAPKDNINPKFLYYYLNNPEYEDLFKLNITGMIGGVSVSTLKDLPILLPPLSEQQKIADYLDKKCSKIDLQKYNYAKSIELLREYRESLIDKTINKSEFKKLKIKYTVNVRNEKSIVDENDNYISLENIESKTGRYLKTEGDYIGSDCKIFYKGDLLINKLRPYLTKSLLCHDDGKCTGEVEVIKSFSGDMRYLKYYSLSKTFIDDVNSSTYGTKMPRANRGYIENIKMPLPPLSEQKEIADYLDKEISKIDKIISYREKMIEKIDEYKKSLIYECVTGKREIN